MKKRIFMLLLILIIFPNFLFAESLEKPIKIESGIIYGPFGGKVEQNVSYSTFNLKSIGTAYDYEELKSYIYNEMKDYNNNFSIEYKGDTLNLKNDISRIWDEIFEEDEYLFGTLKSYGFSATGYVNNVTISFENLSYHTTKSEEDLVKKKVEKVLDEIINPSMSEFKKVKAINDWIVLNTEYSTETKTSEHAAYTLFNEGKGVCQAYALATYKLIEEAGMEVRYIIGKAGKEYIDHGWNQVKVDGEWYNLDTTWNDPYPNKKGQVNYTYFLMSDKSIEKDHFPDLEKTYEIANDTRYEYMNEMEDASTLGEYIYYSSKNDGNKLYKNKIEEDSKEKLTDDMAFYLVGCGDWIYYSNYSDNGFLYKIKTDGKENTILNRVHSIELYLEDKNLNYFDNDTKEWRNHGIVKDDDSYKILDLNDSQKNPKYMWTIEFNQAPKSETVNFNNIYIEDESGKKLNEDNFSIEISENNSKVVNIKVSKGQGYIKDKTYYLVAKNKLKSLTNQKLTKSVKLPFIIR